MTADKPVVAWVNRGSKRAHIRWRDEDSMKHGQALVLATDYTAAIARAEAAERLKAGGWISLSERRPERNTQVIYWHLFVNDDGGFPAIADEWRDEHHLSHASHWLPYTPPLAASAAMQEGSA